MGLILIFLVFGGLIYLFASRRSRRDDAVELRVGRMIAAGQSYATFSDLYYEAARSYAIAKGATASDEDGASATMLVNGRAYFVVFVNERRDGTTITVTGCRTVDRELMSFGGVA